MDNHQFPQEQTLNLGINAQPPPIPPGAPPEPAKRRPGRPKGSVKKNLLGEPSLNKAKRPVGRPRKDGLPAGSVKVKKERPPPQQPQTYFVPEVPVYPTPTLVVPIDPTLTAANDRATLVPNALLSALLAAMAAPNPVSSGGPTVEEAFKIHLASLAPNQNQNQVHAIPSLYSILKTFWLPSSPAYFSLTASAASTARTPSEHRFLYWDPLPLVFNGISCPQCGTSLINKGRISSGPLKIYDLEKPFFIIGCEYVCQSSQCEGRKFASTDASILRALPVKLKDEFPAKLLHDDSSSRMNIWNWKPMGVSWSLWNMVHGALRAGLKKDLIMHLVHSIQKGVPTPVEDSPPLPKEPAASNQVEEQQQQQPEPMSVDMNDSAEAYNNAWRENTAAVSTVEKSPTPAPPPPPPPPPQPSTSTAVHAPPPPATSASVVHPQQAFLYAGYPYASYTHMAMNGQIFAAASSSSSAAATPSYVVPETTPTQIEVPSQQQHVQQPTPAPAPAPPRPNPKTPSTSTATKRSPRHCCKCGAQDCKGKGGRNFCLRACQDCGKLECKGRNSRRPDKKCSEGWV